MSMSDKAEQKIVLSPEDWDTLKKAIDRPGEAVSRLKVLIEQDTESAGFTVVDKRHKR